MVIICQFAVHGQCHSLSGLTEGRIVKVSVAVRRAWTPVSARGLQVVNGGQTTASIHRAKKQDGVDISSVFVQAKITTVVGETLDQLVPKISQYANTQNVIQMADFSANDPFHVEIERLSQTIWCPGEQGRWFYER